MLPGVSSVTCASLTQEICSLSMAHAFGRVERCLATFRFEVYVCSLGYQVLEDLVMTVERRPIERRVSSALGSIDLCTRTEQQIDRL